MSGFGVGETPGAGWCPWLILVAVLVLAVAVVYGGEPVNTAELLFAAGALVAALIAAFGAAWWLTERECTRLVAALEGLQQQLLAADAVVAELRRKLHDQVIEESERHRALRPLHVDDMPTVVKEHG